MITINLGQIYQNAFSYKLRSVSPQITNNINSTHIFNILYLFWSFNLGLPWGLPETKNVDRGWAVSEILFGGVSPVVCTRLPRGKHYGNTAPPYLQ